jgi:hypothetical protein
MLSRYPTSRRSGANSPRLLICYARSDIAHDNTDTSTVVTIASTDKGFKSARCGTWNKVE